MTRTNDLYAWSGALAIDRDYTANGLNQYSAVGGTSFTHDANGNLTGDGTQTYVYDVENRLVSRSGGGTSATLRYDPLGRLYEVNGSVTGITRFLYDGSDLVAEYNGSGTLLRRYVHGLSAGDDPLVWFEGSGVADGARRYLYADERGSIVAVTDSAGNVLGLNSYDEYGIPGSSNAGRFQYTGQAWLPELGLYHYKARMYSPTLGRFMQTDPIGYGDGMNMYAYVKGDPVNKVDPTGLACTDNGGSTNGYCDPENPDDDGPPILVIARLDFMYSGIGGMGRAGSSQFGNATLGERGGGPQSGHDYRNTKKVCRRPLTSAEKRDLIRRFTVPNSNAGLPAQEGYNVVDYAGIPGGVVYTTFSSDGLAGRNVTTPVHAFVGTVDQTIVDRGGASYLNTHSYGSAGDSWLGRFRDDKNQSMGPVIFDNLGSKAALYAAAHYPGC